MTGPLAGLRVVDFGQGVAGPYCGQLLADHGADVVKIEPPRGDWSRTLGGGSAAGMSGTFVSVNRSKRGLCLDLKQPDAIAIARALALRADVVVESFRPGVMDRLGLGWASLSAQNSGLVYCSVTGFGSSGPNVELPAGDSIMQAYGGLMSIIGERDGQPLRVGNVVSDMLAGTNALSGVLLALLGRTATGRGRRLEVSLLDSIVAFQGPPMTEYLMSGRVPARLGNDHPLVVPSGAVRTADSHLVLTVLDHQWPRFAAGVGLGHFVQDPRFATAAARAANREAMMAALAPVFASDTTAAWIARLRALDVLCSPVQDYPALAADPQVVHSGLLAAVATADGGSLPMLRNPVRLDGEMPAHRPPPLLGEHGIEILAGDLRMGTAEICALLARRTVIVPRSQEDTTGGDDHASTDSAAAPGDRRDRPHRS